MKATSKRMSSPMQATGSAIADTPERALQRPRNGPGTIARLLSRRTRKLATALAGAGLMFTGSQAMAQDCAPYVANLYTWIANGLITHYEVEAVRVTARGTAGFSSFSMGSAYSASSGISTGSLPHEFYIQPDRAGSLTGQFQDVFPGRTDGSSDLTTLSILRSGQVRLRMDDWGGSVVSLSNLQCFPGHTGSAFVLTGQARTAGWGLDMWMFLIVPGYIG